MRLFYSDQAPGDTEFLPVVKRPIVVGAAQIQEPFVVYTREGRLRGEAGDFLMRGVEGELYPCAREIFLKTYEAA